MKPILLDYINSDRSKAISWAGGSTKDVIKSIKVLMYRIENYDNTRKSILIDAWKSCLEKYILIINHQ